ncbi:FliI/YscN family ATPase [Rubellimicrobium aerolatum]|uniref:FliI/YscN family ATPase n=1 Tax=Rubellimicrobium aerolatum TaxID=490979 RepID=A0ABW0S9V8_9RHOB|nr:FliI/YscN family ATPase [Rubellimicrobium aerolatum]MBP1805064.1 flagellum-specific ATP synthase [Rubellimicrobium aerolatum]
MADPLIDRVAAAVARARADFPLGRVAGASGGMLHVSGLSQNARLGDRARVTPRRGAPLAAEVIRIGEGLVHLLPEGSADGVSLSDPVRLEPAPAFAPDSSWIGRVVDPDGRPLDGRPLLPGPAARPLRADPPPAGMRRAMGARTATGYAVFDTLLPLAQGQRIGLFAGSGVGKSTLLAGLARGVAAEVVVIGLVGERGRELRHFVEDVLGPDGMARAVVVAATSDRAPQVRRRCALAATAVAEHFRDEGRQVLLLLDSVTRFAEAHREVAVSAGEPAALRGFPASTGPAIAALCERAGPGAGEQGDITAIYSVLVQGSDMEEPVADWLRGVLDGHVVLDRAIAERGRFPAVDLLRSVSRSLPGVASRPENQLIGEARALLGAYDRAALMIRAGLYAPGSDPEVDAAVAVQAGLDRFLAQTGLPSPQASFAALRQVIAPARPQARKA